MMLAKCSNPSCSARFRYLGNGRLFLLESDPALTTGKSNRVEYFWLCRDCCSTMTLGLGQDDTVAAVPLLQPFRSAPDGVSLISVDRRRGLLLHSISSRLISHFPIACQRG